jgi:hypothetical protein
LQGIARTPNSRAPIRTVTNQISSPVSTAAAALRWLAGLAQLLLMLVCAAIAEYGPVVGHHLGRAAGRTVRLGQLARRWYVAHLHPVAAALVLHLDRAGRAFVTEQLGTAYPALTSAIASVPAAASVSPVEPPQPAPAPVSTPNATAGLTRRQLLALAKARKLPRYSRMSTSELREAIAIA